MSRSRSQRNVSVWSFRREVTLGAVVQLGVILVMAAAGWANLQKELALIQRDLGALIKSNSQLRDHMEKLAARCEDYECRLRALEGKGLGCDGVDGIKRGDKDSRNWPSETKEKSGCRQDRDV